MNSDLAKQYGVAGWIMPSRFLDYVAAVYASGKADERIECAELCRLEAERLYAMKCHDHSDLAMKCEDLEAAILERSNVEGNRPPRAPTIEGVMNVEQAKKVEELDGAASSLSDVLGFCDLRLK